MSALPKGWVETTLENIAEVIAGQSPDGSDINEVRSGRPFFQGKSEFGYDYPEPRKWCVSPTKVAPSGSILISVRAPVGPTNFAKEESGIGRGLASINGLGGIDNRFIRRILKHVEPQLKAQATGTTFEAITSAVLKQQEVPLPPLAEQKRIVAKLDALNAKSTSARIELARIETLVARYKQTVLGKAFSGELTREWRAASNAAEPREGNLAEVLFAPVRNGLSVKGSDTPPGFPSLKLSALRGREVNVNDVRYIPINESDAYRFLVEPGDILISRGNGTRSLVGIASLVPTLQRPTIFPDTAFRIRVDREKATPSWLASLWNAQQVRSQLEASARTTAGIWKISQADIASVEFPIPSTIEEQHEIVRRIESAFATIDRLSAEAKRALDLLGKLDEAILAKAFRGELVPQDETDETAEQLLARIRAERAAAPKGKKRPVKRMSAMLTARDFLKTKLPSWPDDGISFQDLRNEFNGSYEELKDAVFAVLSGENAELKQVFDEKRSAMMLRKR